MTDITDDTPATLAQHKVQAGDVVLYGATGLTATIVAGDGGLLVAWDGSDDTFPVEHSESFYTVISRATPAPLPHGHVRLSDGRVVDLTADKMLPFGMLDADVQEAMWAHGGPYQMYGGGSGGGLWADWECPAWSAHMAYRVAPLPPAPKVETVTLDGWMTPSGNFHSHFHQHPGADDTPVRIVGKIIDGMPQLPFAVEAR